MSDDESPELSKPVSLAERLLRIATNRTEERIRLVERWARAHHWTPVEGIALAWTLDPATLGKTELVRTRPEDALPEEARHYLDLAFRSSALLAERITPTRFMEWAVSVGLAFHSDWLHDADRAAAEVARSQAEKRSQRRRVLIRRWARSPYWTPEEGAVLACDLDPKDCIRRSAGGYDHPTLDAPRDANHLLDLARRAIKIGALDENASPFKFLTWSQSVRVEFHPDWWDAVATEKMSAEETSAELPTPVSPEPELKTKERETLLKMVAAMAMAFYGWDQNALRSKSTSEIAHDLAKAGVPLDTDTIRKWLRQGADLIPKQEG